jgi:regulatory protein
MNLSRKRPGTVSGKGAADQPDAFDGADPFDPAKPQVPKKTISLMARAIGYLSRREHSTAELARKLAPFAQDEQETAAVLEKLAAKGMLSDARYAASVMHRRGAKFGAARVAQELKAQGVEGAALEEAKEQLKDSEFARCKEVWQRKFGEPAASREEAAKQARFLAQRGFAMSVVMKVVKGAQE